MKIDKMARPVTMKNIVSRAQNPTFLRETMFFIVSQVGIPATICCMDSP
ncbi:hypothetical protein [Paenibacillus sp. FSL H8-0034]